MDMHAQQSCTAAAVTQHSVAALQLQPNRACIDTYGVQGVSTKVNELGVGLHLCTLTAQAHVSTMSDPSASNDSCVTYLCQLLAQLVGDDLANIAQHLRLVLQDEHKSCQCHGTVVRSQAFWLILQLTTAKVTTLRARTGAATGAILGACMDTMQRPGKQALWIQKGQAQLLPRQPWSNN